MQTATALQAIENLLTLKQSDVRSAAHIADQLRSLQGHIAELLEVAPPESSPSNNLISSPTDIPPDNSRSTIRWVQPCVRPPRCVKRPRTVSSDEEISCSFKKTKIDQRRTAWRPLFQKLVSAAASHLPVPKNDTELCEQALLDLFLDPAAMRDIGHPTRVRAHEFCSFMAWVEENGVQKMAQDYNIDLGRLELCQRAFRELNLCVAQIGGERYNGFLDLLYGELRPIQRLNKSAKEELLQACRQNSCILEASQHLTLGHQHCRNLYPKIAMIGFAPQHRADLVQQFADSLGAISRHEQACSARNQNQTCSTGLQDCSVAAFRQGGTGFGPDIPDLGDWVSQSYLVDIGHLVLESYQSPHIIE